MISRPYLDYYSSNKIIPVKQDVSDLSVHLKRRSILYHYLHIPPTAVRGRRVLEIGPGTGDNAIHIAALMPDWYVLLDGNPYSIAAVKERLSDNRYKFHLIPHLECIEADVLTYRDNRRYDLVICEGVIPAQTDPTVCLQRSAGFVDRGGLLIVTAHSAISLFAEVCRRLLKPIFARRATSPEDLRDQLMTFLTPHLQTLPGRSRVIEDWVRDNMFQPWPRSVVFTIEDIITAIGKEFDIYGTSPQFIQDFRWYKAAVVDTLSLNDLAKAQAAQWSALFIDYRIEPGEFQSFDATDLETECLKILTDTHAAWTDDDLERVAACVNRVQAVGQELRSILPLTSESIQDFVIGTNALLDGKSIKFNTFTSWFGRGQQYVSLLRNDVFLEH